MVIKNISSGSHRSNCYFLGQEGDSAILIDPSVSPNFLTKEERGSVVAILLTHGHFDHMVELEAWRALGIPLWIGEHETEALSNPSVNVSPLFGYSFSTREADRLLRDGEEISLGDMRFQVIYTPGHTAGGICLYGEGVLFSGDTLFADGGYGRYDLPGGDPQTLFTSLSRLLALPQDTVIYPGHGRTGTVGEELRNHKGIR